MHADRDYVEGHSALSGRSDVPENKVRTGCEPVASLCECGARTSFLRIEQVTLSR